MCPFYAVRDTCQHRTIYTQDKIHVLCILSFIMLYFSSKQKDTTDNGTGVLLRLRYI